MPHFASHKIKVLSGTGKNEREGTQWHDQCLTMKKCKAKREKQVKKEKEKRRQKSEEKKKFEMLDSSERINEEEGFLLPKRGPVVLRVGGYIFTVTLGYMPVRFVRVKYAIPETSNYFLKTLFSHSIALS